VVPSQQIPLFDLKEKKCINNPLPMQYLGSKTRIAKWILAQIQTQFPEVVSFVDPFAGTGSVSIEANDKGYQLFANDVQPYSSIVLKSLFCAARDELTKTATEITKLKDDTYLLANGRSSARSLLEAEKSLFKRVKNGKWCWEEYRNFCEKTDLVKGFADEILPLRQENAWNLFVSYYANTYFGVEQCLQLDTLREYAHNTSSESLRTHILAATITAMTYAVSSTTHLAQYLKPTSARRAIHLIERRSYCLIDAVVERLKDLSMFPLPEQPAQVSQTDFRLALDLVSLDKCSVVYVDPPYFKEHYSRYYHVLDTFYLYDYPKLTYNERLGSTTVGRYREDRTISDFGLKSSVQKAFSDLFALIYQNCAKLALSYADTSLVSKKQLIHLAEEARLDTQVQEVRLMHSGQGQPRNKTVTEFLFLMQPKHS